MSPLRLATLVVAALPLIGAAKGQGELWDDWRYVPAAADRGAAAELGETGTLFRIQCDPARHVLAFEYFPDEGGPADWTEEARNRGIELILYYPASDTETTFVVHGPATADSLTGTLPLTADLSDEIADAPEIQLYGENGPSNRTFGGAAAAVRRVATECAPPRTGPKPPKVEHGREKSDW
ncbi:hypothetical protein [Brevundimonas sp. Root1279]|uniref:hypothetical protein n=1 Tax=Brevundimonas sp. Root1279 TaxID=1736443 RepID=UPI0006F91CCD|nr:hypothetical protein [Brevundimonas sp. Root1279]KQW82410.1 hypothetical protein ASC65_09175 [Brevundimonas sp. Root1279]